MEYLRLFAVSIAVPDYAVPPGNKSISNIALLS